MKKYLPMIVILALLFLNGCAAKSATDHESVFWSAFSDGWSITLHVGGYVCGGLAAIAVIIVGICFIIGFLGLLSGN